ncbi:uncharacterized protein (DUF983 family) [Angulomicrobium tetraedrale]|uniref:Uncharacterized protein (DUF983 family) n=1 Tax=Ancylobacter tetraedralis TaxID=217068 RepID=A0A839Z466_9HYPH|nr:DUF983 domain-containing protein [Ancylobacter tetraedralis]MBB3769701.1 uncharacterized protein (DUF983 family) [Ancylobacter tetraedralis]
MDLQPFHTAVSPYQAGLTCRCPRCGRGKLFSGFLTVAPRCEACGLDYSFDDSGDGPVVFIILLAGSVVVGLALWVEITWMPPFWVHAVLWTPLVLLATLGLLRPLKATMIALQYARKAEPGRLDKGGS